MNHTPGPWTRCVGNGAIEIRGEAVLSVTNPRVCRILKSDPRYEANARLIASAPALLEMLKRILRAHESGNNGAVLGEAVLCEMFASMAREVIAEAESKQ